eukprot:jgi/Ulvmu1/8927/UM005_0018.1
MQGSAESSIFVTLQHPIRLTSITGHWRLSIPMDLQVGERISVVTKSSQEVHVGTVRFVGALIGKSGTWAGVEWDNPCRGKHDGSYEGARYFHCDRSPSSASFLNAEKVRRGTALTDALYKRYVRADHDLEDMSIETSGHRRMAVTLQGADKIGHTLGNLHRLESATIHDANISLPGAVGSLETVLPNLRFLGLSNNLLWCWEHVHLVAASLPNLQTLDVSFNRLRFMNSSHDIAACKHLRALVANGCEINWQDVVWVSSMFCGLEELYISSNLIDGIESDTATTKPHSLDKLKVLDITDNAIMGWGSAVHLSALSALTCLKLSGNTLHAITLSGKELHNIHTLLLADCGISDWASVNALARLPNLRDLRLTENPVLQLSSLTGRNECIARLAAITQLNGASVSTHERRDCELQYLYRVQQRIADLGPAGPAEAELHPRLEELCAIHGNMAIQPRQQHTAADATLGERLVALDLVYNGAGTNESVKERTQLPRSTTMALMKMLCAEFFGLDVNLQRLVLHSGPRAGEEIGEDNSSDISYWNLQSGDVIEVSEHEDAEKVWRRFAGFEDEHIPEHWLLPPELRSDLAEITQSA